MAGAPTKVGSPIQRHTNQASTTRHAFTARCHPSSCHSRVPASFTTFDERRSARSSEKIAEEDRGGDEEAEEDGETTEQETVKEWRDVLQLFWLLWANHPLGLNQHACQLCLRSPQRPRFPAFAAQEG